METTTTPTTTTKRAESRTPLWLVIAAAIVATAAALAGQTIAAPDANTAPPSALPGGCDDEWGCGMSHNEVLARSA